VIERFEPGWAPRSVTDVRRVLATCGHYPVPGGTVAFAVIATGLAGADSLLVEGIIGVSATYFLVIRDGPLVSTVEVPGTLGEPFVRRLAAVPNTRLGTGV
jgi:hypothetical protein